MEANKVELVMDGGNNKVVLNGEVLRMVKEASITVTAGDSLPLVTIKLYAEVVTADLSPLESQ